MNHSETLNAIRLTFRYNANLNMDATELLNQQAGDSGMTADDSYWFRGLTWAWSNWDTIQVRLGKVYS